MKKKVREEALLPGDIILTAADTKESKAIRGVTKSDISHAMLYVSHCSVIHALGNGVHSANTQKLFYDAHHSVHVLRWHPLIPSDTIQDICNYARVLVGTEYALIEALRSPMRLKGRPSRKQFCSRLVAQAYENSGYKIVSNADYCTPADILNSLHLIPVKDAVIEVSDEDAFTWQGAQNLTILMAETTNAVLNKVRELDPDIQNLEDLVQFVAAKPEHDSTICNIYKDSGYLYVWKVEHDNNPWHYDLALMDSIPDKDAVASYCRHILNADFQHHERSLSTYQALYLQYRRTTFALLIQLYQTLVELNAQRAATAREWLKKYGMKP